jgi:outer membrane murein-binding lipoprotein Lpp
MDFVNNDLERMDKELELWKEEFVRYSSSLEEEEKKTDEMLKPLKAQISKLAEETTAIVKQIQAQKAEIYRSDTKIQEMMHFIVNVK